nr:hypothetical protein [Serratia fonticola]
MSDFVAPLPSYSLDRAAGMLCTHGANCDGDDLLTLWRAEQIELCLPLPDYVACEDVDAPGRGKEVLLSVTPESLHVFWESVDYPPDSYAQLCVKTYGSQEEFRERKLFVPVAPDYSAHDDNGQRLSAVLSLTYGEDALRIPGNELVKVWRFLTQPSGTTAGDDKPLSSKTVNNLAIALKAFIQVHYGADVVENLRKNLEDPTSEISQDFIKAGIKVPGGRALQNHLKGIVIEVLPSLEKVDVAAEE